MRHDRPSVRGRVHHRRRHHGCEHLPDDRRGDAVHEHAVRRHSTYTYTPDGDLSSVTNDTTGAVTASTSDAYGQQAPQGPQGTQSDTYDALSRDVQLTSGSTVTGLSYQGNDGQLVFDGTATTPGPQRHPDRHRGGRWRDGALDLTNAHKYRGVPQQVTTPFGARTFNPQQSPTSGDGWKSK
jgi:hypothetical protein